MADEEQQGSEQQPVEQQPGEPTEEEVRAHLEEEIRKVRVEDVVLQSVVSILNLSARRIAKDDERDLAQAKIGIDAAQALVGLVKPDAQAQLRHAGEAAPSDQGDGGEGEGSGPEPPKGDSGLWTPG